MTAARIHLGEGFTKPALDSSLVDPWTNIGGMSHVERPASARDAAVRRERRDETKSEHPRAPYDMYGAHCTQTFPFESKFTVVDSANVEVKLLR